MEKKCSACKKTFNCQNEMRGCWCEKISLSHETLLHLRESFEDCLCPECLQQVEHNQTEFLNENKSLK